MRVGQRLFLSVLPAVLGSLLVAALAYWGRDERTAPGLVILLAALATIISLIMSWRNTRYVVHRVERLAGRAGPTQGESRARGSTTRLDALRDLGIPVPDAHDGHSDRDELDYIEATVAGLSSEVARAREEAVRQQRQALERAQDIEGLLQAVTSRFASRTEDAQLPLHILLSSPFGALNENQEEMLGAAMSAVDAINTEVRELQKLLQLHRGELSIVTQPVNLAELLRPALAIAGARAESAHVQMRAEISDTAPRVLVDAVHAQEALTSILADAIAHTEPGGDIDLSARDGDGSHVRIGITRQPAIPNSRDAMPLELRLARKLLEAQHCTVTFDGAVTRVELPAESTSHVER